LGFNTFFLWSALTALAGTLKRPEIMANLISTKKSIGISFSTQYAELVISFLGVLALARILSPDDIGTYSVAAFLMAMLHVFRDFGVVQYIIQERELTTEKIQAAMGVAIILALTVAIILLASSGMIARFYENPAIEKILMVMSASFAISPFGSLLFGIFRREMELQKIFYIKIISAICHVTVALLLAINEFGAISLAWANFAGILSFGIVANLMRPKNIPWSPRFRNIKTILSFGGIASIGNAANIAGTNISDLVIGKTMNMAAVGYFSRATGLVQLFTRLITSALLPLVLPYFAQLRREGKDLAGPYLAAVEQLTALAWPFFTALMLLAYPMVRTLYGSQWDASVPIVELLCLAGAISSISLFATQVMVANGQVRDATYSHILALPIRIGAVLLASTDGLISIAIALIVSECLTLIITSWFLRKTIKVSPIGLIKACRKSALVALCSSIAPFIVKIFWEKNSSNSWIPLSIGISGAAIGWICSILLVRHPLSEHLISLIQAVRPAVLNALKITRAP
jgi:O-antigen/teichoic acid export membrane protein